MPTPKQIARMEQLIAQGMIRFILVYGVVVFGGLMFVIKTLLVAMAGALSLGVVVTYAIVSPIGGAIFGVIMWFIINKQYRNAKQGEK